jgi:hypothetical protein
VDNTRIDMELVCRMIENVWQPWLNNQCLARRPQAFFESGVGAWALVAGTGAQYYLRVEADIWFDCRVLLVGDN